MNEKLQNGARSRRARRWGIGLLALGLAATAAGGIATHLRRSDELRHFTAQVQEGEIRDTVEATGTMNAVINVQVGSQVSGAVAELNADFNTRVKKGDILAVIDPKLFQGALDQAIADFENAEANVTGAVANVKKAQAVLDQTKAEFERSRQLAKKDLLAASDLDLAKANYESAVAMVDGAEASVAQAKSQVSLKKAAVAIARTNLDYTVIRSPIDGIVVARSVDVGQTVAASLQAPTLFTIAQDLTKMLVYAKVDESDVGRIRSGQAVTFKVDGFPKDQFTGRVKEIRMNPTIVQNVVTYDTIIEFENPELKLFPGMTGYVTIPVATAEHVVKIPNAALRYKPPLASELVRSLYAKYGIDDGRPGEEAKGPKPPGVRTGGAPGPSRSPRVESAVVWQLSTDGSLQPVKVALGITDHTYTEVTRVLVGTLKLGDEVVTTSVKSNTLPPGAQGISR
jgi:HlyD family secretion protein